MERGFGDLTREEANLICERNTCPLCGSEGFYHGPQGGGMVNILCDCGAVFNVPNVWEGMPSLGAGQYLRDDKPRSQKARDSRKTYIPARPKVSAFMKRVKEWWQS